MSEYVGWLDDEFNIVLDQEQEIVRCRDCKNRELDPEPIDPGWPYMCADSGRDMLEPWGFCAWGEKKEDGK